MLIDHDHPLAEMAANGGHPDETVETPKPTPEKPGPEKSDADENDKLDEELEESFPASDPPASTQP